MESLVGPHSEDMESLVDSGAQICGYGKPRCSTFRGYGKPRRFRHPTWAPDGKDWKRYELHKSSGPVRHDNCSKNSRPLPKEQIVRQGMHPHPGPADSDHSRGQKERVLGSEAGVDDAYTGEPMSSLQAALSTKRTIDDEIGKPRNIKQRTAGENDHDDARVIPAPR